MANVELDPVSGRKTTGHEWDGIKELNSPLPKWWVSVFFVCVIWSVGYWILYPSWPTLHTYYKGAFGYSSRGEVANEIAAAKDARKDKLDVLKTAPLAAIIQNPALFEFARRGGEVVFKENCVPCHQAGGAGAPGYPNLADDVWLWGGTLDQIRQTVTHGVRSANDPATHVSEMPRFGADNILTKDQIAQAADFVLALGAGKAGAFTGLGKAVFAENCAACHGEKGTGSTDVGAPPLASNIWLYSGTREAIIAQITNPRHGVMPAWGGRLDETTIKELTVFVHSLGGGK